jgi:hypothetical protein
LVCDPVGRTVDPPGTDFEPRQLAASVLQSITQARKIALLARFCDRITTSCTVVGSGYERTSAPNALARRLAADCRSLANVSSTD